MTSLVTGAAGFIGSHLAERLVGAGDDVVGVDSFSDYYARKTKEGNISHLLRSGRFKLLELDLASAELSGIVRGVDYIFHLAAQPGVRASWGKHFSHYVNDNIVATQRLLEATKGSSVKRFIYASSSSIYGDSEHLPTSEDEVPRPNSPYGVTKLTAEMLCRVYHRSFGVPTVALRYFTVYGPRQRPDMAINAFIDRISKGMEIEVYGDGNQMRDYTYVNDTVSATVSSKMAAPGATYNVGTGSPHKLNEVIGLIESETGKRCKVKRLSAAPGDVRSTSADTSRIVKDLGVRATTILQEGIREQIKWQLKDHR